MLHIFLLVLFFGGVDSEDCKGKPDGHYDISCRSYVECKSEVATTVNCPTVGNTQYVYDGGKCVNASTVGPPCGDLRDCTGKADGGYPDHYNNCTSYYVCSSGHFFGHHLCAPGLVYDEIEQICNWIYNVSPPCGTKVSILGK